MSLPLKKIYVDTRYRTPDSISTSNFKIELPYSLTLPDNSSFQLTDICIEHSWLTVETALMTRYISEPYLTQVSSSNYLMLSSYPVKITQAQH